MVKMFIVTADKICHKRTKRKLIIYVIMFYINFFAFMKFWGKQYLRRVMPAPMLSSSGADGYAYHYEVSRDDSITGRLAWKKMG
jgi:hypothetical protein